MYDIEADNFVAATYTFRLVILDLDLVCIACILVTIDESGVEEDSFTMVVVGTWLITISVVGGGE